MSPITINTQSFAGAVGAERAAAVLRIVQGQRSGPSRFLLMLMLLVIVIPIAVLMLLAALAAGVVIGAGLLVSSLIQRTRQLLPRSDGRENVRVVRREH